MFKTPGVLNVWKSLANFSTIPYPESLSYSLDNDSMYPYYASQLKPYHANNPTLFPNHELAKPGPVLTPEGLQEHVIESWTQVNVDMVINTLCTGLDSEQKMMNGSYVKMLRIAKP